MAESTIKEKLIANGVNNLKQFGYPNVNSENIMTDEVYKMFFRSMLTDNYGKDTRADAAILNLIQDIDGE